MPYVLLALILIGVWLFALFDVLSTDEAGVRHLPKFAWFMVVLLGLLPGAVLWLLAGRVRRQGALPAASSGGPLPGTANAGPPAEAPKGPEDDPAFLRELERRLREED
ncbi:PLDc N-terminal domain-containing protein [Actinomadura rugatobispora]|uniref:PLDc N-terminal domain-containing protein n=1 Tax=Actinomadura rugatobispora TaxID=1994 RepID=A0ABW1A5X4_9ACTN